MNSELLFLNTKQPTTSEIQSKKNKFVSHFREELYYKIKKYTTEIEQINQRGVRDYFEIGLGIKDEENIGRKTKDFIEVLDWIPALPGVDLIPGARTSAHLVVKGIQTVFVAAVEVK